MNIRESEYKGLKSIEIETEDIIYRFIPELGLKLSSIYLKREEKEILYQSEKNLELPWKEHDSFIRYDNSGVDDIIPTMKISKYPGDENIELFDRGDIWDKSVNYQISDDKICYEMELESLPLMFEKTIEIEEDSSLKLSYKVKNLSEDNIYYLWTLQNFLNYSENAEFLFDKGDAIPVNVITHDDLMSMDIKKLSSYRPDRSYKYFFWGKRKNGNIGIDYKEEKIMYNLEYDVDKIPYLGILVNRIRNKISIEPTNSFFDSIEVAKDNNSIHEIKGNDVDTWDIKLKIKSY